MLLSVFTRHSTTCRFSRDRACRRCNCPKWVGGQVNGYYFRQSAKTRQWAEAEEVRVKLEEALIKGLPPFGTAVATGSAPPIPTQADPPPASRTGVPEPRVPKPRPRVTVAQAVEAYLADAVSRSVESSTLKKLETIFRKQFLAWTRVEGIEYLDELELDTLLNFRNTWEDGPLAKQKKQSRVIGFFWACVRRRYGSSDSRRIETMTHPIKAAITVGEPNWGPLELVLPACDLENFMYMGRAGEIELYKHWLTRRYLNISADVQRFYRYSDGTYVEVTKAVALDHVRKGNSALRVSWVWTHATNLDQYYYYNNHPSNYVWDTVTGTTPPGGTYSATATGPYDQTLYGTSQALDQTSGWSNDNALQASYQRLFHGGFAYEINYVWSKPFRIGGNWSRDGKLYPYQNFAPGVGPAQPSNIAPYAMTRALNRYENYMVDTGIPKHHIQFNGIYDLPLGHGKQFLGNANRWENEIIGGFQIAGSGSVISQDFAVGSGNWGPTNPIHIYKHSAPITDCRSGTCLPSFLWFNGYIAPTSIAGPNCTTKCVSGLPSNYVPYQTPIDNTPGTANYGSNGNNVTVNQNGGKTVSVAYSPGPSTNPFAKTVINGPFNYIAAASLFKVFPITERVNLRFNWDVFNVLNDQGYLNPNTTDGTESLQSPYNALSLNGGGQGPRVMQLSLRLSY